MIPKNLKKKATDNGRVILAYGEVTGHSHQIEGGEAVAELSTDIEETRTFLTIKERANLVHEEHTTHTMEPGQAEVTIQSQYVMGEFQRVAD